MRTAPKAQSVQLRPAGPPSAPEAAKIPGATNKKACRPSIQSRNVEINLVVESIMFICSLKQMKTESLSWKLKSILKDAHSSKQETYVEINARVCIKQTDSPAHGF